MSVSFAQIPPPGRVWQARSIESAPANVDLWAFSLAHDDGSAGAWWRILSDDERNRANRFLRETDRDDYIVAHGVLRRVLAQYCGLAPDALILGRDANTKPIALNPEAVAAGLSFNLAHSHGRALLAVARSRSIGVDLEQERDDVDLLDLARQFFFGSELAAILSSAPHLQRSAFFRHWVAKESVLKAQGVGLSFPLDRFCVTFELADGPGRIRSMDPARLASDWVVRLLPLEAGWHGAVVAAGEQWTVRFAT